jgi:pimeloyl-ACP methyl ester carboxylesterase
VARSRRKKVGARASGLQWALAAVALGLGAGLAAERALVGRSRRTRDPYESVPYGKLRGDRLYEVTSFDGTVLVSEDFGSKGARSGAIFLHGYCLDRSIWHHQMEELDGVRRFVYFDARNHGRSLDTGSADAGTLTLAKDLKSVLDQSGLDEAVLVGHSMGGMAVLEFCREFSEELGKRVKGIVLANTTYTDAVKTLFAAEIIGPIERSTRRILNGILYSPRSSASLRLRGDDLSWLLVKFFGFGPDASPAQIGYAIKLLGQFPNPPLVEMMNRIREFDMEEALEAIDVPTLIIAGGSDRFTTVRASEKIHEEIKGSRLEIFENQGHMTMMEGAERFNSLLSDFLDETITADAREQRRRAAR